MSETKQNNRPVFSFFFCIGSILALACHAADMPKLADQQYKRIHRNCAEALVKGYTDEVIDFLEKMHAEKPEDADTPFMLGMAFAHKGEPEKAITMLRKSVTMGLPIERVQADANNLLAPLAEIPAFQAWLEEAGKAVIHGPMIGQLTDKSALIWLRGKTGTALAAEVSTSEDFSSSRITPPVYAFAENDNVVRIPLASLKPATLYHYRVLAGGEPVNHVLPAAFTTLPEEGKPAVFRIGFGGGAGYVPQHEYVWDTVGSFDPCAFFFLGDNVYIDLPELPRLQRFCYYRRQSLPEFRRFTARRGVFAIWDDHDFGDNDCWGGPLIDKPDWKQPVWRIFQQNWANPPRIQAPEMPGCHFRAAIADVDFFMLDCRYYRVNPRLPKRSMLGPVQKRWLCNSLKASTATFKVICSSVPVVSGTKGDSRDTWDGFPEEREEILSFIASEKVEGVMILSADRHRSDAWKIAREDGYDIYEFESSRMTNQHVHEEKEAAIFSYNKKQSFGILDFDTTIDDPRVTYRIVSIDGEVVHSLDITKSGMTFRE
jgi:alkaline phosphatase D